ncbi:unnamed protein product [Amoebophrya sp. A25]|nr:unnamed protein product [Amoebophrya sp. A25]|eukprot:GSA25T00016606001.1
MKVRGRGRMRGFALRLSGMLLPFVAGKKFLDATVKNIDDARSRIQPVMGTLSKLDPSDIEYIVQNHFWDLATEIVTESHKQKVDLSFAVRKAVQGVRNKADELIRYLNPKYHEKQKVTPVYRWAQNSTHVFVTIKYSVKWDAPGAVNVKDPQVVFDDNVFRFTASGEHSGNKYEYSLDLDCFDAIDEAGSTWSAASVGRFTAVLAKRRMRRWPRLLLDKKKKGTGRPDLGRQEELDKEDSPASVVMQSEKSCAVSEKIYCPHSDKCMGNCTTCAEWNIQSHGGNFCSGAPQKAPDSVVFTDSNMMRYRIDGELKIESKEQYHVDSYVIKYGVVTSADRKADELETIAEIPASTHSKFTVKSLSGLRPYSALEAGQEMALAVFSKNTFGVLETPVWKTVEDAFVPESGPKKVSFSDTNGDVGKLTGDVVIEGPTETEDPTITQYALYFAKRGGRVLSSKSDSYIGVENRVAGSGTVTYKLTDKSVPTGTQGIIAFAKNSFGENREQGTYIDVQDAQRPCAGEDRGSSVNCPPRIKSITGDASPEANVISVVLDLDKTIPKGVTASVYLATDKSCTKASNYKAVEHQAVEAQILLDNTQLNGDGESWRYSHILLYTKNDFGTSKYCSAHAFTDAGADIAEKAEL